MSDTTIITELNPEQLQKIQANLGYKVLVLKFGATWCGPCKTIKPLVDLWLQHVPGNIVFAEIDVEESMDLYAALKRYKMISGIPHMMAFYGDIKRDLWYIADDSVTGSQDSMVKNFLNRCVLKARALL